jgi:maltose/moltooligosaccharide transporter
MTKPPLNFWQLWNMSFGFLGIQFGWGLQMANSSAIFEYLGANPEQIPLLWLAAPMTGLLVQPIVGNLSDNTWGPLGRRRPYFLVGAIFSSLALIAMPNASNLWIAAGLLWILDSSVNISMEPFRAFVGDLLPEEQRTTGFAMQSLFIGLGAVTASALPWMLSHWFQLPEFSDVGKIPFTVTLSFYIGAAVFFGAVIWTVATTQEYPPEDLEAFRQQQAEKRSPGAIVTETWTALKEMPSVMRQLAWVQCFTWLGLFCMFLYFPPAVARNILGATSESSPLYTQGIEWAGLCIATYNAVCFGFAFLLPKLAEYTDRKTTHTLCLLCGAAGLVSLKFVSNPYWILPCMIGVGILWASVLAIPYAILIGSLPPKKTGIYMGIFNFFIVLPEIIASLGLGWVVDHWLGGDRLTVVVLGGGFLVIAALAMQRVQVEEEFIELQIKKEESAET